jgi:hypothetical protein
MLRGWKSASCNGFPAASGATGDDLIEVPGNLPARKNIPMLSNQRLRSIPLINPPVSLNPASMDSLFMRLLLHRLLSLVKVG